MMNELWKRHLKLLSLIFTLNCLPKTSVIRVVHSEHTIPNKQVCGTQAYGAPNRTSNKKVLDGKKNNL